MPQPNQNSSTTDFRVPAHQLRNAALEAGYEGVMESQEDWAPF